MDDKVQIYCKPIHNHSLSLNSNNSLLLIQWRSCLSYKFNNKLNHKAFRENLNLYFKSANDFFFSSITIRIY